MTLRLGTRASKLALAQTALVSERLHRAHPGLHCEVVSMTTRGDEVLDRPLPEIGGKGVFTDRIEAALRGGEIDAAVHSLKDLPVDDPPGLALGAVLGREEVRDAIVSRGAGGLSALRSGAVVGTSSTRRRAQLLAARPDLTVTSIRGNVETRVRRVEEGAYDATLLAGAGLGRLALLDRASELLPLETMLPAPGQGALAVQCRAEDSATLRLLRAIDEPELHRATDAERGFLRELGGGCSAPIAAYAHALEAAGAGAAPAGGPGAANAPSQDAPARPLHMIARVVSPDGRRVVEVKGEGVDPRELAARLAREALAHGAARILAERAPLFGRTLLITRPADQGAGLAERLSALGATAIVLPLIRIEAEPDAAPIDAAIDSLARYRWVLFTSANGVRHFCDRIEARGAADRDSAAARDGDSRGAASSGATLAARAFAGGPRVAAVGEATARELEARGVAVELVPPDASGVELARALIERDTLRGARVLLPRAREGGEGIVETLRGAGALVEELAVYRTVALNPEERELEPLRGRLDAVLLMSGSAARSLATVWPRLTARAPRAAAAPSRPAVVCFGAQTGDAALAAGLPVDVVAPSSSTEALAEALQEWFSGRSSE